MPSVLSLYLDGSYSPTVGDDDVVGVLRLTMGVRLDTRALITPRRTTRSVAAPVRTSTQVVPRASRSIIDG